MLTTLQKKKELKGQGMTDSEILALAEKYLVGRNTKYIKPGQVGKYEGDKVEVIFLKPEALDPDVVIDPPDIRVLVDIKTKEVLWIRQM